VATFMIFFFSKLLDGGHTKMYSYPNVVKWGQCIVGVDESPLCFDVLLFLCNLSLHWYVIVLFPKGKHIEGMDYMHLDNIKSDVKSIWQWLNDEL
jgi:hypothetical protein